jgi:hypothetical protein
MHTLSEKRLAANRANAAKSTGPTTPEGKQRSSQNARKHGFAAGRYTVVRFEQLESIEAFRAEAIAIYQPVNSQELIAVERIALSQHAILRCAALEAGLFSIAFNEVINVTETPDKVLCDDVIRNAQIAVSQNRSFLLATGFQHAAGPKNAFRLFLRYQAQTERLYRRAVEDFERLKALRSELPNEPTESLASEPLAAEQFLPQPPELDDYGQGLRLAALADPQFEIPLPYGSAPPIRKTPAPKSKS